MDAIRRSSLGFAILVIVWIVVYWWWEPKPRAVAFDRSTPAASDPSSPTVPVPAESARPKQPEPPPPLPVNPPPETKISPPPTDSAPAPLVRGVEAPVFRSYTIRAGDTFEIIARRELGSSSHAAAIARSNPLLDPTRLRRGQEIRIPVDPSNIQGRQVSGVPATGVRGAVQEYTVKAGDTLGDISRAVYGSSAHWRDILDANRGVLKDEKSLRAGQRLLIPPREPSQGDSAPGPR